MRLRRSDPGLSGGIAETRPAGVAGLGPIGIVLVLVGVAASYLSCLHEVEFAPEPFVAFGVWSLVAIIVAFIVDRFFKYALALVVLFCAAMWWVDATPFKDAVSQSRSLRSGLCDMIKIDQFDVPVKEWIC